MGVYQIKNQKNGKVFVSSSMNLPAMKNRLQFLLDLETNPDQLNLESHPNIALRSDWSIYGSESFSFEILETIDTEKIPENERRQAVAKLEEQWLDKLQPYGDTGYNKPSEAKQANS
jgi:hypothetical protein